MEPSTFWKQTVRESLSVTGSGFGVVTTLAHLESLFLFSILNLIMLLSLCVLKLLNLKWYFGWDNKQSNHITYKKIVC